MGVEERIVLFEVGKGGMTREDVDDSGLVPGGVYTLDEDKRVDRDETTVVFDVGKGGKIREEVEDNGFVPGGVEIPVGDEERRVD